MNRFEKRFLETLGEDFDGEGVAPSKITRDGDRNALANTIDPDDNESVSATEDIFSTSSNAPGLGSRYDDEIGEWKKKMDEFAEWLNGANGSLNSELVKLDKAGSKYENIAKDTKKITDIAGDLSKIAQGLGGWVFSKTPAAAAAEEEGSGAAMGASGGEPGEPVGDFQA